MECSAVAARCSIFGILPIVRGNAQGKHQLRTSTVWGTPERLHALFRLRLEVFRQFIEHVRGFMNPTPWPARLSVPLAQRLPTLFDSLAALSLLSVSILGQQQRDFRLNRLGQEPLGSLA
jgi:hypothetical protein